MVNNPVFKSVNFRLSLSFCVHFGSLRLTKLHFRKITLLYFYSFNFYFLLRHPASCSYQSNTEISSFKSVSPNALLLKEVPPQWKTFTPTHVDDCFAL